MARGTSFEHYLPCFVCVFRYKAGRHTSPVFLGIETCGTSQLLQEIRNEMLSRKVSRGLRFKNKLSMIYLGPLCYNSCVGEIL